MTSTASNQKSYFDIHTSGIGYIQRVREVQGKAGRKAQPSLWCTVAALVGPADNPIERHFDVRVSGAEAKQLIRPYLGINDRQQRPLVSFRIGDLWLDPFFRTSGDPDASMKGRLLKVELLDHSALAAVEQLELTTRGIGYLSSPRITANNGIRRGSCTIAALAGPINDPELRPDYRYIETSVTDTDTLDLIQNCVQAIVAKQKVLLSFKLNDMEAKAYVRTKGDHAGEAGGSLKSTLTHIGMIKVDGVQIHPQESEASATEAAPTLEEAATTADNSESSQLNAPVQVPVEEPARAASF
ncbi:TPA: DUF3577 domain-containing protein [Pseudomonas aeruginosa]|nr:DUF3577 domain-containing protein [Pseudomonas aeruginosa]